MSVRPAHEAAPRDRVDLVVVGAGAAGLCAALAAGEAGARVVVLERDAEPKGATAMTLGMLPGAGTRLQREKGIEDSAELFLADILAKARGRTDAALARVVARASGPAVEWLTERHGVALELLDDILYPGHSRHRYHLPPGRTGAELQAGLLRAVRASGARILTSATVERLFALEDGRVTAVGFTKGEGARADIACKALVLACGGYGAWPEAVARYIPEMATAVHGGHHGSRGDALRWGEALGATCVDPGGYQGHCVTRRSGLPLTWAPIIRGGFQVNRHGHRFSNEMSGYSEQAAVVQDQPGGVAWTIYDRRCEEPALRLEDYRRVIGDGAVVTAGSVRELALAAGLPAEALAASFADVAAFSTGGRHDPFGRDFTGNPPLEPPFHAVEVQGALFHTQGGLAVDDTARVLRADGTALPNLMAAGGAARGLSGPSSWGYLGGNGLLTAVVLGRLAGETAARLAQDGAAPAIEESMP